MNDKLPEYTFDEIETGLTKQFQITITESMIDGFAKISGDYNPLHMDEKFAQSRDFKNRVCHGMLLGSLFSRLIGMYIPGKFSLYFSQSLNFRAPCFIEDVVTITGTVTEKHNSTKMLTLKTVISNQNENCLVDGIAKVIVRD